MRFPCIGSACLKRRAWHSAGTVCQPFWDPRYLHLFVDGKRRDFQHMCAACADIPGELSLQHLESQLEAVSAAARSAPPRQPTRCLHLKLQALSVSLQVHYWTSMMRRSWTSSRALSASKLPCSRAA